jgi:predicted enzyme related to lactoylglutathione lyase
MTVKNPVGWFELYVRDIDRAKVFYEKVLNVSLTQLKQSGDSLENMWAFPMNRDGSGATGAIAKMDGAPVGAAARSSTSSARIAHRRQSARRKPAAVL